MTTPRLGGASQYNGSGADHRRYDDRSHAPRGNAALDAPASEPTGV